jgi:hypothetical protein
MLFHSFGRGVWQIPYKTDTIPALLHKSAILLYTIRHRHLSGMPAVTAQHPGQHIGTVVFLPGTAL